MQRGHKIAERRTSVDEIFENLYEDIVRLRLLPGDKISEADIAAQFGVSRQPVRDAFSRLSNMDLLLIRPQRATEVRRFSPSDITKSRFVRLAVEKEVIRLACENCDAKGCELLFKSLEIQNKIVIDNDFASFGVEDYRFHQHICKVAKVNFAAEVISTEKANVDRLCNLSISKEDRMPVLLEDHTTIAKAIADGDTDAAISSIVVHLSRLDETIEKIQRENPRYFEER